MRSFFVFVLMCVMTTSVLAAEPSEVIQREFTLWGNPKETHRVTYLEFYSRSQVDIFTLCEEAILWTESSGEVCRLSGPISIEGARITFGDDDGLLEIPQNEDITLRLELKGKLGSTNLLNSYLNGMGLKIMRTLSREESTRRMKVHRSPPSVKSIIDDRPERRVKKSRPPSKILSVKIEKSDKSFEKPRAVRKKEAMPIGTIVAIVFGTIVLFLFFISLLSPASSSGGSYSGESSTPDLRQETTAPGHTFYREVKGHSMSEDRMDYDGKQFEVVSKCSLTNRIHVKSTAYADYDERVIDSKGKVTKYSPY